MRELNLEELNAVSGGEDPGLNFCRQPSGWFDSWNIGALREQGYSLGDIARMLFYR